MSALKYVCLSDLHLGAAYSVMTQMNDDGKIDLGRPSGTLSAFGAALRQTVSALSGPEPPVLILLGDTLDLGLSSTGAVIKALQQFIQVLFPPGAPAVFSTRLLCVPGNHDHHLWRAAQDQHFLDTLDKNWNRQWIPSLREHTPLFDQERMSSNLLTQVMRKYPGLENAQVNVCYPNLGLSSPDRSRCIVLHHGHFLDGMYRALSTFSVAIKGHPEERPKTSAQLERENGPWIEFLWSGLGGGGVIAKDAAALYETSRSAVSSHTFAQHLSTLLLAQLNSGLGVSAHTPVTHGLTVENLVKGLVDLSLLRGAELERDSYATVMSPEGLGDLRWYLGGPVLGQMVGESAAGGPPIEDIDLSFVFGHTHKPFQAEVDIEGYAMPVAVYNTGGWVMDQPTMAPTQGAAAILIDDEMRLASLRLFNDPLNGTCLPVRAAGVGGFRDSQNPLLESVQEALGKAEGAWQAFSGEASAALVTHARVLMQNALDSVIQTS